MIHFITGNLGKFNEVKKILAGTAEVLQLNIDLPEIQSNDPKEIISYKISEAFNYSNGEFIVEDTSLYLECLNGLPGPFIKFFLKKLSSDEIVNIVKRLEKPGALAETTIGYTKNRSIIKFFSGQLEGDIVPPKGKSGFGWDALFKPNGYNETLAEMEIEEKNRMSHRYIAASRLKEYLSQTMSR
jgi:inosine triphosphate pyrophosphatase